MVVVADEVQDTVDKQESQLRPAAHVAEAAGHPGGLRGGGVREFVGRRIDSMSLSDSP